MKLGLGLSPRLSRYNRSLSKRCRNKARQLLSLDLGMVTNGGGQQRGAASAADDSRQGRRRRRRRRAGCLEGRVFAAGSWPGPWVWWPEMARQLGVGGTGSLKEWDTLRAY